MCHQAPLACQIESIEKTTPKENKELRKIIKKQGKRVKPEAPHSYSPNVNRLMESLKSISPKKYADIQCKDDEIYVTQKNGRKRCVKITSKIAKMNMLNNLLSKRPINCDQVIGPKQSYNNCWFNCFFITFFVSDKARKFFRFFRMAMITGNFPTGEKIPQKLKKPFLLLNKYIDASIHPPDGANAFANVMDTNNIIRSIARAIGKKRKQYNIFKTRQPGNPLSYYLNLFYYINGPNLPMIVIRNKTNSQSKQFLEKNQASEPWDIIIFSRFALRGKIYKIDKKLKVLHKGVYYTYQLDSAILQDTKERHVSAYITCNKKEFAFDGESFSRMEAFKWKNRLNKNVMWRFAEKYETYFNFRNGHHTLFYYRV